MASVDEARQAERRQRRDQVRRRRRWAGLVLLLAGAATAGALATAFAPSETAEETVVEAPPAPSRPEKPTVSRAPGRPQFVLVSFDGAGAADLLRYWRRVGRRAGARFTFFLSGVYLLGERQRLAYLPPRQAAGSSDIGFMEEGPGPNGAERVRRLLLQLAAAQRDGHEIGTHYNGHFCGASRTAVGAWTAADWRQEISQFDALLARASAINHIDPPISVVGAGQVFGSRTPCLEGDLPVLRQVLRERGFRYDASTSEHLGAWPRRIGGVWGIPLSVIQLAGTGREIIAMDYNVRVNQPADPTRREARAHERQALESFDAAFETMYRGPRAPLSIGYHFARWNHGAYIRALTRFLGRVCTLRDVRCVTHSDLIDWLEGPGATARRKP